MFLEKNCRTKTTSQKGVIVRLFVGYRKQLIAIHKTELFGLHVANFITQPFFQLTQNVW